MKKKYFVSCSSEDNIDKLITELITPGLSPENTKLTDFIPIFDYLSVSPSTIILELSQSQVDDLKKNPLVVSITEETGQTISPTAVSRTINSTYSSTENSAHHNWGMSRCNSISGTPPWDNYFTYHKTGKGVDVVIIDSGIKPNHPEFLNSNGVSRVVKENWSLFFPVTSLKTLAVDFAANTYYINGQPNPTIYVVSDKPNGNGTITYRTEVTNFNLGAAVSNDPFFIGPAIGTPFNSTYVSNNGATSGTVRLSVFGANRAEYTPNQNVMYYWSGRNPAINGIITRTKYNTQTDDQYFYNDTGGHGTHCSGTVAGSAYGWAIDANIYSVHMAFGNDPGGYGGNGSNVIEICNLIKNWHNKKKLNPIFRPTVTSHSYEFPNASYNDVNLAVKDLIDNGVHFVHSAGNDAAFKTVPTDARFYTTSPGKNNVLHIGQENSPCWPNYLWTNQLDNPVICVGALGGYVTGADPNLKAAYSNYGPGVSLYAPGTWIVSADYSNRGALYPGSTNYYCIKYSGTSMACPQVAGILATLLEDRPLLSPLSAKYLLLQNSLAGAINDNENVYTVDGEFKNLKIYSLGGGRNLTICKYPANYVVVDSANELNFAKCLGNCYIKTTKTALSSFTYNSQTYYMHDFKDLVFGNTCS